MTSSFYIKVNSIKISKHHETTGVSFPHSFFCAGRGEQKLVTQNVRFPRRVAVCIRKAIPRMLRAIVLDVFQGDRNFTPHVTWLFFASTSTLFPLLSVLKDRLKKEFSVYVYSFSSIFSMHQMTSSMHVFQKPLAFNKI